MTTTAPDHNPHRPGSRAAQMWPFKGATAHYEKMARRMALVNGCPVERERP